MQKTALSKFSLPTIYLHKYVTLFFNLLTLELPILRDSVELNFPNIMYIKKEPINISDQRLQD